MKDFSIIEKLRILFDVIISSPIFLICSIGASILLIIFIISIILDKKINKWIFISIWSLLFLTIIIIYHSFFFNLIDNLFNTLFMALYFPDLSIYIIILFIANYLLIYSIFSKKVSKAHKILNVSNGLIIDIILIFIIDTITKNNINVYEKLTVYSNSTLLVLIELTTAVFTSWILLNLLVTSFIKLKCKEESIPEKIELPELIFDN